MLTGDLDPHRAVSERLGEAGEIEAGDELLDGVETGGVERVAAARGGS